MSTPTKQYDALPLILRLILQLVLGVVVGGVYRIVKFLETRNLATLIVGWLVTFTGVGNVLAWIIDFICLLLYGKYTIFAD